MTSTQRVVYYSYDIIMSSSKGDEYMGCRVWEAVNPKSPIQVLEDIQTFVDMRFNSCRVVNFRRID